MISLTGTEAPSSTKPFFFAAQATPDELETASREIRNHNLTREILNIFPTSVNFVPDLHLVLADFNELMTHAFAFRYKTSTVYFGQFQSANAADTTSRAREIRERTVPLGQPSTAPTDS